MTTSQLFWRGAIYVLIAVGTSVTAYEGVITWRAVVGFAVTGLVAVKAYMSTDSGTAAASNPDTAPAGIEHAGGEENANA